MLTILLDMDGVIANFTKRILEHYNHLTNEGVKISDLKTYKTSKYVGDPYLLRKIKDSPGFIRYLEPIDGAIDGVRSLKKDGHDICFVSNATNCPTAGHEKREWLKYYFGVLWQYPPLVLTKQKYRVRGDVLIDDDPNNLKHLEAETKGLLFSQPYNASVTGYERIYDWSHVLEWVRSNG